MNKIIIFGVIGLIATVLSDPVQETKDTRKVRLVGPIAQTPNSNLLGSSQDGGFKPITAAAGGTKPTTAPIFNHEQQQHRFHEPIYGQPQPQPPINNSQNGQYIIAVNPQLLPSGQGPVLMQYLSPQGQPQGALQYFQIIRPYVYPVLQQPFLQSQIPTQIASQAPLGRAVGPHPHAHTAQQPALATYQVQPIGPPQAPPQTYVPHQPHQPHQQHQQHQPQQHQPHQPQQQQPQQSQQQTVVTPGTSYNTYQQPQTTSTVPATTYNPYQQPIASYSHPSLSYYTPQSRLQLVNPPKDLILNTNEYMPSASELNYKTVNAQPPVQRP